MTLEERFWMNVHCPMHSECWNWLAYTNRYGYGEIGRGKRVYPGHLFLGTRADNNRHASECGIKPRGEGHWKSKLIADQVKIIRKMPGPQRKIAKLFGIGQASVSMIKNGKNWGWLPS
jgi:hypothetical protein